MSTAFSDDEGDSGDDNFANKTVAPMGIAALLQQYDEDSQEEDEDEDDQGSMEPSSGPGSGTNGKHAAHCQREPEASAAAAQISCASASGVGGATTTSTSTAGCSSSLLPSADELLDPSSSEPPDFLKLPDGPDFDASKHFKPPPVSHADMMPAVHGAGSRRPPRATLDDEPPEQRYHQDHVFGRGGNAVRQHGSVCHETDEERGRRVVYGAHQALKADPWSNCNPNLPFKGFGTGKKRKAGDT